MTQYCQILGLELMNNLSVPNSIFFFFSFFQNVLSLLQLMRSCTFLWACPFLNCSFKRCSLGTDTGLLCIHNPLLLFPSLPAGSFYSLLTFLLLQRIRIRSRPIKAFLDVKWWSNYCSLFPAKEAGGSGFEMFQSQQQLCSALLGFSWCAVLKSVWLGDVC